MAFRGSEQSASYGELVSIGDLNPDVNKKVSVAVVDILSSKLSVPKSRFFLKIFDSKVTYMTLTSVCFICQYVICFDCLF